MKIFKRYFKDNMKYMKYKLIIIFVLLEKDNAFYFNRV